MYIKKGQVTLRFSLLIIIITNNDTFVIKSKLELFEFKCFKIMLKFISSFRFTIVVNKFLKVHGFRDFISSTNNHFTIPFFTYFTLCSFLYRFSAGIQVQSIKKLNWCNFQPGRKVVMCPKNILFVPGSHCQRLWIQKCFFFILFLKISIASISTIFFLRYVKLSLWWTYRFYYINALVNMMILNPCIYNWWMNMRHDLKLFLTFKLPFRSRAN